MMKYDLPATVNGVAGRWEGAVLHVDAIHFKPDGIGEGDVGNLWDKLKEIANTDTLKTHSAWDESLALNDICSDEDEFAEAIGVRVEQLIDPSNSDDDSEIDDEGDEGDEGDE